MTNTYKRDKCVHVHFKDSGADFYFGSIAAIFYLFTPQDVGVTQNRLYQVKLEPGKPYRNKVCTINVGPLYRKRGNRNNVVKLLDVNRTYIQ
jgi:hypothetical protein